MKKILVSILLIVAVFQSLSAQNESASIQETDSIKATEEVIYELNAVLQYGGESKLGVLFPKINFLRKHQLGYMTPYYGVELGVHPLFVTGIYDVSAIGGIEKGCLSIETSFSYFTITKYDAGNDDFGNDDVRGPYNQTLWNLKLGFQIFKRVRLKLGRSFLLNEHIPASNDRPGILDFGKINGNIYSFEIQYHINL